MTPMSPGPGRAVCADQGRKSSTPKPQGHGTAIVDEDRLGMGKFQDIKKDNIEKPISSQALQPVREPPCVQVCPVGATYQAPDGWCS